MEGVWTHELWSHPSETVPGQNATVVQGCIQCLAMDIGATPEQFPQNEAPQLPRKTLCHAPLLSVEAR